MKVQLQRLPMKVERISNAAGRNIVTETTSKAAKEQVEIK